MNRELRRNEQEGMIAGVCAGLADYMGLDKSWVRFFFVLSVFFSVAGIGLIGPLAYLIIWIAVPRKPFVYAGFEEPDSMKAKSGRRGKERQVIGFALLIIGGFLLILQLDIITWNEVLKFWPVGFIVLGLIHIFHSFPSYRRPRANDQSQAFKEGASGEDTHVYEHE